MAELHDESRMNFSRDVLTLNFGLRHEFTESYILHCVDGHELRSADQPTALIGLFRDAIRLLNRINTLLKRTSAGRSGSMRDHPTSASDAV